MRSPFAKSEVDALFRFKANLLAVSSAMQKDTPSEEQPVDPLGLTSDAVLPAAAKADLPGLLLRVARWMGSKGEGRSGLRKKT